MSCASFFWTISIALNILRLTIASPVASTISTVTITTDVGNPGDGTVALDLTLYWGDNSYACSFTPSSSTTEYSCDSSVPSAYTENTANPYFLKLQYSAETAALQISMINITDVDGNWYAFDEFCIPPGMTHTMDNVVSGSTTGDFCVNGWQSKVSYADLAMAGDTKLVFLYVDFKIFGDRFANTVNEAGVRPPNLIKTGFTNGDQVRTGDPIHILIQWDVGLYACSVIAGSTNAPFECTESEFSTSFCPGTQSSFFASYYFAGDFVWFNSLYFVDETSRKYSLTTLCKTTTYANPADVTWNTVSTSAAASCTGDFAGHEKAEYFVIGDAGTANANPVLIPDTIFDYPDDASHAVESEVLSGHIGETSAEYCWEQGACAFGYGSPFDMSCPVTDGPTSDPTVDPTSAPTQEPSLEPTMEPTMEPTLEPTFVPSVDPTLAPTLIPSAGPTEDTPPPSSAPTRTPTAPPSKFPTVSDDDDDDNEERLVDDPSVWTWIGAAIVVFCCVLLLLCLLVFWWRRRKKSDADKEDRAPVVIPDVAAAHHEKQATYNEYDAGAINTQPSDLNQDDDDDDGLMQVAPDATEPGSPPQAADGGNNAEVELQEYRQDDAMLSQPTLDGDGGTATGMGHEQGNEAVLNMLADGHETAGGNQSAEPDAVVDEQDTFTDFKV